MSFLSGVMSIGKMTKVLIYGGAGHNIPLLIFSYFLLPHITSSGTSALYWAVKEKKHDFTEALLKAGANPSPKLKKDGSTPLHISAYYKARDLGIARVLLQHKADVNAQ